MVKLSAEAKVGIFVLIGIILLVYMSLRVGGMRFGKEEGYTLTVKLDNAAGLDRDASVKVAGVEVGRIKDIKLQDHKAVVVLRIKPGVRIGRDFTAALKTSGLLGEKYLELIPGSPNAPYLEEGEEITRVRAYADVDKLIADLSEVAVDIKKVTGSMAKVLGGEAGAASLSNIVSNLEEITYNINAVVEQNDERLSTVLANLEVFSDSIKEVAAGLNVLIKENRDDITAGVTNLKAAMETLNSMAPEIKHTVSSIQRIARRIDEGQGTIGKLINDDTTHEKLNRTLTGINSFIDKTQRFRLYVGYRGEYLFDADDTKSYLSLRLQPKADKYYLIDIVDDPRGNRRTTKTEVTEGGSTRTVETTKTSDEIKFSAQIAKRFGDLALRGGIIESTGGLGADYYMFKDRLKLTLEAFDFHKGRNPRLKAGAFMYLNKYFFITAGYDDFISDVGLESAYVGVGLEFEDDDLKYLFSSVPPISF